MPAPLQSSEEVCEVRWDMLCVALVLTFFAFSNAVAGPGEDPTLREVIRTVGAEIEEVEGLPSEYLDQKISSYSAETFDRSWAVGFYPWSELIEERYLPDSFWVVVSVGQRIRAKRFDMAEFRAHSWDRSLAESPPALRGLGSILRIDKTDDYLVVGGHTTPSAAPAVVIRLADLNAHIYFGGWVLETLKGNQVVYHANMVHFFPTHPARVRLIDLVSGDDQEIYPLRPATKLWQDRVRYISKVYSECSRLPEHHHGNPSEFNLSVSGHWYENLSDTLILQMDFGGGERCGLHYDDGLNQILVLYRKISTNPEAQEAPLEVMLSRFEVQSVDELIDQLKLKPNRDHETGNGVTQDGPL